MILIVGGEGSGKRSWARQLGYADEDMTETLTEDRPVVYHVERLVAQAPEATDEMLGVLLSRQVVICDEVGSGIIPIDPDQIRAREATGRLCILLAKRADKVVRMVCGIPTVIKDAGASGADECGGDTSGSGPSCG